MPNIGLVYALSAGADSIRTFDQSASSSSASSMGNDVDWSKVRIESAPADKAYTNPMFGMQGTGGSTSVRAAYTPLRKAGAAAREMLLSAAAETWGVEKAECRAERGAVV